MITVHQTLHSVLNFIVVLGTQHVDEYVTSKWKVGCAFAFGSSKPESSFLAGVIALLS